MAFTYKILANPTGSRPYRAAVDVLTTVEGSAFLAEVATTSGKDAATVEAVLRGAFTVMTTHVRDAQQIKEVLGLFRVFPSCGGSYLVPDPAASDVAKTVNFNITPTAEYIATVQSGVTMQKTGESGLLAPEVDSVTTMPGGLADRFTSGQGLEIRGLHLRGRGGAIPTVQLIDSETSTTLALLVLEASDARLVCSVPTTGLDNPCLLRITTPYGTDQRIGDYGTLLTPAP